MNGSYKVAVFPKLNALNHHNFTKALFHCLSVHFCRIVTMETDTILLTFRALVPSHNHRDCNYLNVFPCLGSVTLQFQPHSGP